MNSIYEEIGGRDAVRAAVDVFYARVRRDAQLAHYFDRTDMRRQKAHMRAFLAAALGGAEIYRGRDMAAAHAGLGITDAVFDRVVEHLVATLIDLGVPTPLIVAIGDKIAPLRTMVVAQRAAA